jgi:starvation-inducible DNA-binding protein
MSNEQLNSIGLEMSDSSSLIDGLNELLANYQIFYQNTRGFHWNIEGEKFFELHQKFEDLYNDLQVKIDEIAERILTLGGTPMHTYARYAELSEIEAAENVSDGLEAVKSTLDSFQKLLIRQRKLLSLSGNADDEGTNALMSDYIREQEKSVWMYKAYVANS